MSAILEPGAEWQALNRDPQRFATPRPPPSAEPQDLQGIVRYQVYDIIMSSMTLRNLRQSSLCFERAPLARWHFRRCASSKTPNQVFGDAGSAEFLAAAASETSIPKLNGLPEVGLSFISVPLSLSSL